MDITIAEINASALINEATRKWCLESQKREGAVIHSPKSLSHTSLGKKLCFFCSMNMASD